MTKDYILNLLSTIAEFITTVVGKDCEITINDLQTRKIVHISNPHITGRTVGMEMPKRVHTYFFDTHNYQKNKATPTQLSSYKNKHIKSSTLIIPDENGEPVASICINIDIENLLNMQKIIDSMLQFPNLSEKTAEQPGSKCVSVREYTSIIMSEVLQKCGRPLDLSNKETKLNVLRALDEQGIFLVREAHAEVCAILDISQATLYNYLNEIRN